MANKNATKKCSILPKVKAEYGIGNGSSPLVGTVDFMVKQSVKYIFSSHLQVSTISMFVKSGFSLGEAGGSAAPPWNLFGSCVLDKVHEQ